MLKILRRQVSPVACYDLLHMSRDKLRICETFFSIQGESSHMGLPCVFIRLTGCHLRCTYCDTAYSFTEGEHRLVDEIVSETLAYPCNLVEITGGEPLLQPGVHTLMERLANAGKTVLIETSGACDISKCDPRIIRILDLKTPGSGEAQRNLLDNFQYLTKQDEVKFVITDHSDYLWSRDMIQEHDLANKCGCILMSPVYEQAANEHIAGCQGLPLDLLVSWILEDGLPVRLQTQLHKLIWDPQTRGV